MSETCQSPEWNLEHKEDKAMKLRAMTHRVFLQVFLLSTLVVAVILWAANALPTSAQDLLFVGDLETGNLYSSGFFEEGTVLNHYRLEAGRFPTVLRASEVRLALKAHGFGPTRLRRSEVLLEQ